MDLKDKRIVFVGLDDVLIKTHSNQEKPVGVWDMEFNLNVLDKLKQLNPIAIFVVSNQPDIPAKLHPSLFQAKFVYVIAALQEYIGMTVFPAGQYAPEMPEGEAPIAMPNPTMLLTMFNEFLATSRMELKREDCVVIGTGEEYAGAAQAFGCDYLDVAHLLEEDLGEPLFKLVWNIPSYDLVIDPENQAIMENLPWEFAVHRAEQINKLPFKQADVLVVTQKWVAPKPMEHKEFKVDARKLSKGAQRKVAMQIKRGGKK